MLRTTDALCRLSQDGGLKAFVGVITFVQRRCLSSDDASFFVLVRKVRES